MYNQKQKSNVQLIKKHKTADRKGGGGVNPYGQPDRKISVISFDDFPYQCLQKISSPIYQYSSSGNYRTESARQS